ncbi:MAG TPA: GNAT family N-acetyltransferase [Acidimicrobiales bacterium]|nr:GNAT family N-acetyltransferase [Acidimicrobiales bacterium]
MADAPAIQFAVRPAQGSDVEALLDLLEAVAAEGRWIGAEAPVDREMAREWMRVGLSGDETAQRFVAEAAGEVVGQVKIELARYGVADLSMWVAEAWRRRGVGTALVRTALDWAAPSGAHKVALQVWPHNHAALALYRKFGFVEEGLLRRHYPRRSGELWDVVVMGLVLDHARPGSPHDVS